MSRQKVLSMISRVERIADKLIDADERTGNSLAGQAMGTMHAIQDEFDRQGVSISNDAIYNAADNLRSASDATYTLHKACGFLRQRADELR